MGSFSIGTRLGPFSDGHQEANFNLFGTCDYEAAPGAIAPGADPAQFEAWLRGLLVKGIRDVVGEKLGANQIAVATMIPSLPALIGEIIAASGAQAAGVQVTKLELTMTRVEAEVPAQMPAPQALPPNPWQATANAFERKAQEKLDPRNYEVHGRVDVGGLRVNMSSDGGIDTAGLNSQIKDKAKTEIIWYAGGCAVLIIVGLGLLGLGWYIYRSVQAGTAPVAVGAAKVGTWDGKSTFTCGAADNIKLEGVTAKLTSGSAVHAGGGCRLELVNCHLSAPTGIDVAGSAVVTMKGGSIDSSTLAIDALGASEVHLQGTKVKGKTQTLGSAKITGP